MTKKFNEEKKKTNSTHTVLSQFPVFFVVADRVPDRFHLILEILGGEQFDRRHVLESRKERFLVDRASLTWCYSNTNTSNTTGVVVFLVVAVYFASITSRVYMSKLNVPFLYSTLWGYIYIQLCKYTRHFEDSRKSQTFQTFIMRYLNKSRDRSSEFD